MCGLDRDADAAARTVEAIGKSGGRAFSVHGDAREPSAAEAVRATLERFRRVDVLVNNVGGMFQAAAKDITANGWSAVIRANLDSTFLFAQAVAPAMLGAGGGSIVNAACVASIGGSPGRARTGRRHGRPDSGRRRLASNTGAICSRKTCPRQAQDRLAAL